MAYQELYESPAVTVARQVAGSMDNNIYVLTCTEMGEKIAIDATSRDVQGAKRVLITHGHHDHITSASVLAAEGVDLYVGKEDSDRVKVRHQTISDGELFEFGRCALRAMHTPGHTRGSVCFLLEGEPLVFTGDTLFPGGPGATHFEGGDFDTILESISTRLFTLPDETRVLPGHGATTTIGNEAPHLDEWRQRGW